MDFGGWAIEITRRFEVAHAEHAVFDGPYTVDAPLIVGYRLGELTLDWGLGVEAVDHFFAEGMVGVHVFGREHDDARGESVAEGVHAGTSLALWSSWSVGFLGVETVGCVLSWRRHRFFRFKNYHSEAGNRGVGAEGQKLDQRCVCGHDSLQPALLRFKTTNKSK
jgi:hypothetical protein